MKELLWSFGLLLLIIIIGIVGFVNIFNLTYDQAIFTSISIFTTLGIPSTLELNSKLRLWFITFYSLMSCIIFISVVAFILGSYFYNRHFVAM